MSASKQIDKQIAGLTGWRGRTMAHLRKVIDDADPALRGITAGPAPPFQ